MKTVLFVWEIGEGLGHVGRLVAIADALQARDPTLSAVFALKDPVYGRTGFGNRTHRILPAPQLPGFQAIQSQSASFADILGTFGYGDAKHLRLALMAWDDLFAVVEPDLIVADYSPTACLAARGRIPVLVTGNGFSVPPWDLPAFPPLKIEMQSSENQTHLLGVVTDVLSERNVPPPARLPEFLKGDQRAVFTLPQLDPYQQFRKEPVLGPYVPIQGPMEFPREPRLFLYSRSEQPNIDEIAQVLWESGVPVSCYIRGGRTVATAFLESAGAEVFDEPRPLPEIFAESTVIISHGGGGIAQAALAAGRPQIIMPNHLEATITGRRIEALGAGITVEEFKPEDLANAIAEVNGGDRYVAAAMEQARLIASLPLPPDPLASVADLCVSQLGSSVEA